MESLPPRQQALRSSTLKRPLSLWSRDARITADPEGSVRSFESYSEGRALFGFERAWLYKMQAGVLVQAQKTDWSVKANPNLMQFSGRLFDCLEVVQSVQFLPGATTGYARAVRLRNAGQSQLRLRIIGMFDPTAAQFESSGRWGSIGLNAFNRDSHIAMDEVSDPPSARVIGTVPQPSRFYMTTSRPKAQDLVASGELPEATAGMSGQVIVLSLHDLDLAPGETRELAFVSIYNPTKLEDALGDFRGVQKGERRVNGAHPLVACSSQQLADAAAWAASELESQGHSDALDQLECLTANSLLNLSHLPRSFDRAKASVRRDGAVPHSAAQAEPGVLETALALQGFSRHLVLAQDKRLSRSQYPTMRKMAMYLMSASKDFTVRCDKSVPQGWRRHLGRGFPTGEIPEVLLAVAGSLAVASQAAVQVAKPEDAARFKERSELLCETVRKRLTDERGFLSLCLGSGGRLRAEEAIDMAVAAYRHPFNQAYEQAAVHRLMEPDFETPYGPRCVPTTNQVYFNRTYGSGQLGGYWTRAALAYVLVCYRAGLPGIGSLTLQKIAKLVTEDSARMRGSVGEFPLWADLEGGEVHGEDSDRVAAARLVEALIFGEGGVLLGASGASISPPGSSSLGWIMVSDVWLGEPVTFFVGRAAGKAHTFFSAERVQGKGATRFSSAEPLEAPARGVCAVSLSGPGQVICLGNSSSSSVLARVSFAPRAHELSKRLSTPLESLEPSTGSWEKVGTVRVLPVMTFEANLRPGDWKAFRVAA